MSEEIKYGRKRRGIRRELSKKIESWLMSIDDIDVQAAARKDCIVTGGAIASMLLGEEVQDFDIYFRTQDTTLLVAKYYVDKFKANINEKTKIPNYLQTGLQVKLEDISNIKGQVESRVVIFISSDGVISEEEDIEDFSSISEDTKDDNEKVESYRPVFLSQNAITLSDKIQLVTRFYGKPKTIHSNYDFVHAKSYYDHNEGKLKLPAKALEALLSRTLVYEGSLYPVASIFRVKKFLDRGWRITAGEQLKIMFQISEIDLKDISVLREQLLGCDVVYMKQLVMALEKSKAEGTSIDSTYMSSIINKIFND